MGNYVKEGLFIADFEPVFRDKKEQNFPKKYQNHHFQEENQKSS